MVSCSIIIPTLNRANQLYDTMYSLVKQNFDPLLYDVIVVDNGSKDNTKEIVENFINNHKEHQISYIFDDNPGLLTGRHRGVSATHSPLLVFVDDDILADPDWLRSIINTFSDPSIQLVGGRNLPLYETPPPNWIDTFRKIYPDGGWSLGALSLLDFGDQTRDISANDIWGLNLAIRRQALISLGGFHPDSMPDYLQYFQGDGETGLTIEANKQGYRAVYQPKALVHHRISSTRLTLEYFEKRAYFQGVCDSFSTIRRDRGICELCRKPDPISAVSRINKYFQRFSNFLIRNPFRFQIILRSLLSLISNRISDLQNDMRETRIKSRMKVAYRKGYKYHQNAVLKNPLLLEWVLRDNYWDYKLPKLNHPENL